MSRVTSSSRTSTTVLMAIMLAPTSSWLATTQCRRWDRESTSGAHSSCAVASGAQPRGRQPSAAGVTPTAASCGP